MSTFSTSIIRSILLITLVHLSTGLLAAPGVCNNPVITAFNASKMTACAGETVTLTVTGSLNHATNWHLYDNSCGVNQIAMNPTGTFNVSPVVTTTYFVRGEGFCVIPGACNMLTITILPAYSNAVSDSICSGESYTFPSGVTVNNITEQMIDTSSFQTAQLCDSTIYTTIVVKSVDTSVAVSGVTLTANAINADYQWIDCDLNIPIAQATNQSYTADESGNYAVEVTVNGCTDTSSCRAISIVVDIAEFDFRNAVQIIPNPVTNNFTIDLGRTGLEGSVELVSLTGQQLRTNAIRSSQRIAMNTADLAEGIYIVHVKANGKQASYKILKVTER